MTQNDDLEPITKEEIDKMLYKHGINPQLSGKYYALVAKNAMLKVENKTLVDACKRALEDIGETERMTWQGETYKALTEAINLTERRAK